MTTITDWTDLDAVRNDLGGDYVLGNDLDSNTSGYSGIGDAFEPIGRDPQDGTPFTGTFDGDGHEIADLVIDDSTVSRSQTNASIGLFGGIERNGVAVSNLALRNGSITLTDDFIVPGLLCSVLDADIEDCIVGGSVTGEEFVGGALGQTFSGTTVRRCIFAVDTDSTVSSSPFGGIGPAANSNDGTMVDCYSIGTSPDAGFVANFTDTERRCFWDVDASGTSTTQGGAIGLSTSELSGTGPLDSMADRGVDFVADYTVGVNGENASADTYPRLRTLALGVQNSVLPDSVSSPAAPVSNLSASVTDAAPPVSLSLRNRSHPVDGIRVYRSDVSSPTFPTDFDVVATLPSDAASGEVASIVNAADYTYRLTAVGESVESDPTNADTVTTTVPLDSLAATPADLDGPGVELSWTVNYPTLDDIDVYRTDGTSGAFPGEYAVVASLSGDATATNDTGVEADSDYAYRLTASVDGVGASDPTPADTASLGSVGPFLVTILGTNSPVDSGEALSVDVEIENQGEFTGDVDVAALLTKQ